MDNVYLFGHTFLSVSFIQVYFILFYSILSENFNIFDSFTFNFSFALEFLKAIHFVRLKF